MYSVALENPRNQPIPSTRSLWKIHFYGDCRVSSLAVTAMGSPKWGGVGDARTRELYVIFKIFSLCHFMLTLCWSGVL